MQLSSLAEDKMLIHGHTEECIRKYGAAEQRREDYRRRYPDYCKACGGSGVVSWTENGAPYGAGFWAMEMSDCCDHCSGQGKCPGCGQPVFSEQDLENMDGSGKLYCEQCGWVDDGEHSISTEWDCWGYCRYEEELAEEYKQRE